MSCQNTIITLIQPLSNMMVKFTRNTNIKALHTNHRIIVLSESVKPLSIYQTVDNFMNHTQKRNTKNKMISKNSKRETVQQSYFVALLLEAAQLMETEQRLSGTASNTSTPIIIENIRQLLNLMLNSTTNTLCKLISLDNFSELAVTTAISNIHNTNTSNNNNENNKCIVNYITCPPIHRIIGKWLRNKGNNLKVFQCDMYDGLSLRLKGANHIYKLCLCEFINGLLIIFMRMKRYLSLILCTLISSIFMCKDYLFSYMLLKEVKDLQLKSADVTAHLIINSSEEEFNAQMSDEENSKCKSNCLLCAIGILIFHLIWLLNEENHSENIKIQHQYDNKCSLLTLKRGGDVYKVGICELRNDTLEYHPPNNREIEEIAKNITSIFIANNNGCGLNKNVKKIHNKFYFNDVKQILHTLLHKIVHLFHSYPSSANETTSANDIESLYVCAHQFRNIISAQLATTFNVRRERMN